MRKLFLVSILTLIALPLVAAENRADSYGSRALMWDIYASLYARNALSEHQRTAFEQVTALPWPSARHRSDGLLYLQEDNTSAAALHQLIRENRVPVFRTEMIHNHIRGIYTAQNEDLASLFVEKEVDTATAVFFVNLADRMDGRLDARLDVPDWAGLYHLLVEKRVPPAAVGYNFRDYETWVDRRTVLTAPLIEREIPFAIRRLRGASVNDEKKLQRIQRHISKLVKPSEDGYGTDYWQTPRETMLVGEGDCEDYAILFHALAEYVGVNTQVVIGYTWQMTAFGDPKRDGHAWVEYRGQPIDPIRESPDFSKYEPLIRIDARNAQFVDKRTRRLANRGADDLAGGLD